VGSDGGDHHARQRRSRAAAAVEAIRAGDVDARFGGPHAETPLHWTASSGDVEVLDALVAAGADVEAPGSVIDGGGLLAAFARRAVGAAASKLRRTSTAAGWGGEGAGRAARISPPSCPGVAGQQ
jgi:uncharacterized protein